MLQVIGTALSNASKRKRKAAEHRTEAAQQAQLEHVERARRQALLRLGTWHDGRLDCVAGNGVMSELGVGDERMRLEDYDVDPKLVEVVEQIAEKEATPAENLEKTPSDMQTLQSMPIVVIKNYATKRGRDDIIAVMSTWAASLVDHNIAHVIVLSDNRENAKQLAQGYYFRLRITKQLLKLPFSQPFLRNHCILSLCQTQTRPALCLSSRRN